MGRDSPPLHVGTAIGSLVFLGISPLSPRTGTNTQVSSGIAFGTRGRLLGSGITWFIAVGFFIILTYTSGQAIIETFSRWFGTPTGLGALSVSMILVLAVTCLAAILGHGTLEKGIRGINVVSIIILVMIIAVFASRFHVTHGSNYLLGGFWPTWFIATTTTASLPISWGPFVGDYGRYIPASASSAKVSGYAILGIFSGCWIAMMAAAFAATSFVPQAGNFVVGITQAAPLWLLFPLLIVPGLASNIASAAMSLYNATLDIGAWPFFYKFQRWVITAAFGVVLLGLTYLFVAATNFLTNLEAFVTIMIVTATPWMVIVGIEFLLSRNDLAPVDLHAFAIPGMRGKYWFNGGVNPRAFVAWACGATGAPLLDQLAVHRATGERGERSGHLLADRGSRRWPDLPGPSVFIPAGYPGGSDSADRPGGIRRRSGIALSLNDEVGICRNGNRYSSAPGTAAARRSLPGQRKPADGRRPRHHHPGRRLRRGGDPARRDSSGCLRARHAGAWTVAASTVRPPSSR